jgi:hypothetical protein
MRPSYLQQIIINFVEHYFSGKELGAEEVWEKFLYVLIITEEYNTIYIGEEC